MLKAVIANGIDSSALKVEHTSNFHRMKKRERRLFHTLPLPIRATGGENDERSRLDNRAGKSYMCGY